MIQTLTELVADVRRAHDAHASACALCERLRLDLVRAEHQQGETKQQIEAAQSALMEAILHTTLSVEAATV